LFCCLLLLEHFLTNELSCSICHEIFKDPVFLSCSHSFCRTCIQLSWQNNTSLRCPICRRRSSKTDPPSNLVLKNLCEVFLQEACLTDEDPKLLCSLHGERLKLYCKKDKHPMCVECLIKEHKNHKICSITEAATPHRTIMPELQFEELHQFLRNEEATRIKMLGIVQYSESREGCQSQVVGGRELFPQWRGKETSSYLSKRTYERDVIFFTFPFFLLVLAFSLFSLHLLFYHISPGAVPVTLDPNTADINLFISEDLTSVKETIYIQPFPDNPERINAFSGVLGSEGFSSGKHYWDVAVGNDNEWVVGVAKESINRKKYCIASPKEGFWSIGMSHGECKALTSPPTKLPNKKFHKIRVQLDCDEGKVTFLDLTNNTTLYTFKHKFNERVFPYFFINGNNALIILPVQQLSLKVRAPQD
uniref:Zinc-binding protein A33-like n=1 Tax=Scleropages formosus TaxID=113540 RepID=A0A8C9SDE5_SCLFO